MLFEFRVEGLGFKLWDSGFGGSDGLGDKVKDFLGFVSPISSEPQSKPLNQTGAPHPSSARRGLARDLEG